MKEPSFIKLNIFATDKLWLWKWINQKQSNQNCISIWICHKFNLTTMELYVQFCHLLFMKTNTGQFSPLQLCIVINHYNMVEIWLWEISKISGLHRNVYFKDSNKQEEKLMKESENVMSIVYVISVIIIKIALVLVWILNSKCD